MSTTKPAALSTASPATAPAKAVATPSLIARQPIVDVKRAVAAYELFDRSTAHDAHDAASDISLIFNAMNHTGDELSIGKVDIFINRTHQSLGDGHLDLVQPETVVLKIAPVASHAQAEIDALAGTLAELKKRGFRLSFNHTVVAPVYASWQALADYVKVDLLNVAPDQLSTMVASIKARTKATVIAEKVETAEQFAAMAKYGATLFQGYWVAKPDVVQTKVVTPAQASVLQLFNLVRNQAATEQIEAVLKRDAMLGFNLLRLINSAGFGMTQEVTSFRHAVMLMGLKKLFRWAALLLASSRAAGSPPVVGTTAVVRGRMMELLGAGSLSQEESDAAFVVGVFSLLDDMLAMPMEQALTLLSLPEQVLQALRHGTGVYGEMLRLVKAAESYDDAAFAAAAQTLGYTNHHINMAHMEALVWADGRGL
jgi:EAL and modified HD-GYP domain-containing signal transduction protein